MARGQHGYLRRDQLRACGLSDTGIDRRVARGQLIRVYRGVYAVGHEPSALVALAHAAVLACGTGAVLARRSALSLYGIKRDWIRPFEVATPSAHKRRGIKAHRIRTFAPHDLTTHLGIPVTTVARAVFDVAGTERRLGGLVNEARNHHGLRLEQLAELAARLPHAAGATALKPFLGRDPGPTRSELERRFLRLVKRYGLPIPRTDVPLGNRILDAFYPDHGVIVELDSVAWHADPDTFESDRERDAAHLELGLITVRITDERMRRTPAREAARLERILAARELLPGS